MRIGVTVGAAALWACAGVAQAADKPVIGPVPAWVKPVALPPVPAKSDEAAVKVLLYDQQVSLDPGHPAFYVETAMRIQTPQGLEAGNISIPWRPETDTLTIHKLLIRRGEQVIDVLAAGQTFTVLRRETNLENAVLDGVLTANIQPEGLQVGDIVDLAATITSGDPTLGSHVEMAGAGWTSATMERAHVSVRWPATTPMQVRQIGAIPAPKPVTAAGTTTIEESADHLTPMVLPKGAPARFGVGRLLEVSDYAAWSRLAELMVPLYARAATLKPDGTLQAELTRIKAAASDPATRAQAALTLVQDRVRYVALAMGTGGLVPAAADVTWGRRFGDCKGKTALLLALLHGLDVEAVPVIVNAISGDGIDAHLPMVGLFNHVIVRATIAGHTYWLDGTRTGDTRLDAIRTPNFGWGLPVMAGATLVRMVPPPLEQPDEAVTIRLDASAGLDAPAPMHVEVLMRGDAAVGTNLALANLDAATRDRTLRDYWKGRYDFADVTATTATFDPAAREERLVMDGSAKMDWSTGWYETDGLGIGWKADFSRPGAITPDAPYAVGYPVYNSTRETILFPPRLAPSRPDAETEVSRTIAGVEYHRHAAVAGNAYTIEKTERALVPEYPAKDAPAAQTALRALYNKGIYIRRPSSGTTSKLTGVAADLARGATLIDQARYDQAFAAFDHAVAAEPRNARALAMRGVARLMQGHEAPAIADLDAAAAIAPREPMVLRGRGLVAMEQRAWPAAIAAFTTALAAEPGDTYLLAKRAAAYRAAGDTTRALADAATAIERRPDLIDLYILRANMLRSQGGKDAVLAETRAMVDANPRSTYAHVAAANFYSSYAMRAEAMREFDAALAIAPDTMTYLNRAQARDKSDLVGRRADLDAAAKLEPSSVDVLFGRARLEEDGGDTAAAIARWSAIVAKHPDYADALTARGIDYVRTGRQPLADRDFAEARSKAKGAPALNNLCWAKATAGVALPAALADCDAALAVAPDEPAFLDSRGFVLLRLGRIDDAIAAYGRALDKAPTEVSSLWGRAIAWARKGDRAKSDADAAAARRIDPGVEQRFKDYGVTR